MASGELRANSSRYLRLAFSYFYSAPALMSHSQAFLIATHQVSKAGIPLMHEMIPTMDDLNEGLELTLKDKTQPLAIRHGSALAISMLNKYYSLSDKSYCARFSMSMLFV